MHDSRCAYIQKAFLSRVGGVSDNESVVGTLSLTLGQLVNSAAKAIAAQQQSLDVSKVVLENHVAL